MGGAAARAVPEHRRRALRHCLGVALPALVGFGAFIPEARPAQIAFAQACQWASITVCSVTMPVLAQVGSAGRGELGEQAGTGGSRAHRFTGS